MSPCVLAAFIGVQWPGKVSWEAAVTPSAQTRNTWKHLAMLVPGVHVYQWLHSTISGLLSEEEVRASVCDHAVGERAR